MIKPEHNKKEEHRDALFPDCPIRNILSRIGDKWSLLVLYTLQQNDTLRFKQLQRELPDISQKSLTQTLRILEEDGLSIARSMPKSLHVSSIASLHAPSPSCRWWAI